MKLGAAYIRVSTDMQVELSPDSQLKMIKQYAASNDIVISNDFIFADDGISGRSAEKRPQFMKMIALAKTKPKPFDVILVWKFSRFARNREDSIVYKSMLRKECGIEVLSVSEPVGEDKTSILIEALLEAMDEYYSINLAEEVRRGMSEKASRGGVVNPPPFGYDMKDKNYVVNPNEAPIVKMIFEKYLNGYGTRKIATELNDLGITTKRGNKFDNRNIEYILTNKAYVGKLRWNASGRSTKSHRYIETEGVIISDGHYEPIIESKIFEQVQKKYVETKAKFPKNYNQRSTEYFFRGLVRCSSCGGTLTQLAAHTSLQCHNYARGQCKVSHCISINLLKRTVVEKLRQDAETNFSKLNIAPAVDVSDKATEKKAIQEKIKKEKQKLDRIKAAYEDGIDTLEEYKNNKSMIFNSISELEKKLEGFKSKRKSKSNIKDFQKKLLYVAETISSPDISAEKFNSELREVIDKIVFDRAKSSIEIFYRVDL